VSNNPFKKALDSRTQQEEKPEPLAASKAPLPQADQAEFRQAENSPRKRGRPATGKRSADGWVGRTYYVRKKIDIAVERELLNLEEKGIELDKSELVDYLLSEWVKARQDENSEFRIGEIPPEREGK